MSEKRRLGQFYLVARCDACVSLPQFLQVRNADGSLLMTSDHIPVGRIQTLAPAHQQAVQQMTNEVRSEPPKESAVMLPNDPEIKVEVVRRQHGVRRLLHLFAHHLIISRRSTYCDRARPHHSPPLSVRCEQIPLDEVVLGELVALGRRFSVPFPPLLSSSSSTAKL